MNMQDAFSAVLLDPDTPYPQGISCHNGDIERRFAVYRNNVHSGLINALATSYPVVWQLVGDVFFQAMARAFIQEFPPKSPVMSTYGVQFADFVEGFAPASSVPYLADVARLERLCVQAFHAADACAVDPHLLIRALNNPDSLGQLCLQLHPGVASLDSPYAIAALWTAHQHQGQIQGLDPHQPQSAVVLRNGLRVEVFAVGCGCAAFVNGLNEGRTLELAACLALEADPEFDLGQALALLITHDAITGLHPTAEVSP